MFGCLSFAVLFRFAPDPLLQRRCGKGEKEGPSGNKAEDEKVLEYMGEVVQRTWDQRYLNGVRQRQASEEATKKKEEAREGNTRRSRAAQELEFLEESGAEEVEEEEEREEEEEKMEEEEKPDDH